MSFPSSRESIFSLLPLEGGGLRWGWFFSVIPEQSGIHLLTKVGVKYLQLVIMTGKLKKVYTTKLLYFELLLQYCF